MGIFKGSVPTWPYSPDIGGIYKVPVPKSPMGPAMRRLWRKRRKHGGAYSYFSTLTSATVEDAAPTLIVMTSTLANTTFVKEDFTIAGFTINNLAMTGGNLICTLTVTVAVTALDTVVVALSDRVTQAVTNNVL